MGNDSLIEPIFMAGATYLVAKEVFKSGKKGKRKVSKKRTPKKRSDIAKYL